MDRYHDHLKRLDSYLMKLHYSGDDVEFKLKLMNQSFDHIEWLVTYQSSDSWIMGSSVVPLSRIQLFLELRDALVELGFEVKFSEISTITKTPVGEIPKTCRYCAFLESEYHHPEYSPAGYQNRRFCNYHQCTIYDPEYHKCSNWIYHMTTEYTADQLRRILSDHISELKKDLKQ